MRAAIEQANAWVSGAQSFKDTIRFNIPGPGPHTIQPTSALPTITDPVVIDGYTQPGASPNTNGPGLGLNTVLKIELDGTNAGVGFTANGLWITSGATTVQGLAINRFDGSGIRIETNDGNVVQGNFMGTTLSGNAAFGGGGIFIGFDSSNNIVGGATPEARNVISGNGLGVFIVGTAASGNLVQGNLIGTDVTGTVALGNTGNGVQLKGAAGNTIGGTTAAKGNVISGSGNEGIWILASSATGNLVQGNFIGTDVTGTLNVGNTLAGVKIDLGASGNTIGGTTAGAGNTIAFNGGDGVFVETGTGNSVLGNSIFSNTGLGLDLDPDGVTPNDSTDADAGANNLQNFPVVTFATTGSIIIQGTLNGAASTQFRLEFFSSPFCDPSGYGEGKTFLGFKDVTTDGTGNASFTANFATTVTVGNMVTTTATDPSNNTSEFSACTSVGAIPTPALTSTPTPIPGVTQWGLIGMAGLLAGLAYLTLWRRGVPSL